jgi:hypothetical protein
MQQPLRRESRLLAQAAVQGIQHWKPQQAVMNSLEALDPPPWMNQLDSHPGQVVFRHVLP